MSPEQVRGKELDARTDLFSFGAVLYEMCTGTLSFRSDTSGLIFNAILERPPVPTLRINPDVPDKLEEVINKALEKACRLRYQLAPDIRTDLQRLKRDTESGSTAAGGAAIPRWSRRTILMSATTLALVVALIAAGAVYFGSSSSSPIKSVTVLPFSNFEVCERHNRLPDGVNRWSARKPGTATRR